MGTGPTTRTRYDHDETNHEPPPRKRVKQTDKSAGEATSQFFAKPQPKRPLEEVEDESLDDSRSHSRYFTRAGSQADTIGGSSVNSLGKTAAATSVLPEYRNVQCQNSIKPNRRRRKSHAPKSCSQSKDTDDAQAVKHRNLAPHPMPRTEASPDHLVADNSEDELSRSNANGGRNYVKKATNFSLLSASPRRSRPQRGDIPSTTFKPARPVAQGHHAPSKPHELPDVAVAEAACGKHTYSATSQDGSIARLHLGGDWATVIHTGQGMHLSWIEVQRSMVKSVRHSATHSPFIIIYRPSAGEAGSPLALKFQTLRDAAYFHGWLNGCGKHSEVHEDKLETSFNHIFDASKNYVQSKPKSSPSARSDALLEKQHKFPGPSELGDPFKGEPTTPRPAKLKDRMQGVPEPTKDDHPKPEDVGEVLPLTRSQRLETRRIKRSSPAWSNRERTPDRWTFQNPGWDKDWHRSLVYPPTGKNRATVDRDDIPRLDEGEFLNDNLISFYLRYLQVELEKAHPEVLNKVHIFSTFFFEKLRSNRGKINYEGVKAWTARIDLLSYDYIVVPVNENAHWYLAIIYNAPRLLPQPVKNNASNEHEAIVIEDTGATDSPKLSPVAQDMAMISLDGVSEAVSSGQTVNGNKDPPSNNEPTTNAPVPKTSKRKSTGGNQRFSVEEPRIITLDSLGSAHSPTCKCLRDYLIEEARHKKGFEITNPPGGMTARNIPEQDNYCDCGVFILGYMEHFLKNPDEAVRKLLNKEETGWDVQPSQIRAKVRGLLFTLQKEQQKRLDEEMEKKRQRRVMKEGVSSPRVAPSSPQVPTEGLKTPQVNRHLNSPLTNDAKTYSRIDDPRSIPTTPAYFLAIPPEEPAQPETPKRDGQSQRVASLEDDSNNDVKTSSSGDVFHSARSSPVPSASKVPVDLTEDQMSPLDEKMVAKEHSTPSFIPRLSSSPNERHPTNTSSTIRRVPSPEVAVVVPRANFSAKAANERRVVDPEPRIINSIEVDSPPTTGPQYDGIDRSIDLTNGA
ncbi:hypothetical protein NM208_g10211 [Fusarium decemcellulare]|uniref:Uncharacterized protein n=1 Tax=Fusarium decemcellulare TaxID=57161 RepID=A0ACC1RYP3_9HYPO|nr:hypothetical protein NM208_g10211 [Fusarium decemcellulare]